ncbi:hypothetical protein MASR1M59_13420 [Melaminivora sp.]
MKWTTTGSWLAAALLAWGSAQAQTGPTPPAFDIQMTPAQAQAAFSPPGSLAANPTALANAQALLDGMAQGTRKRILVRVNQGWLPEATVQATLGAQAVQAQRSGIQTASSGVLAAVPQATVLRTFDNLPYLALSVNQAQLATLIQQPGVAAIEEDLAHRPTLNQAVPQVHGGVAHGLGVLGGGQAVAVLDTGVIHSHPFLSPRVTDEACFSTADSASGVASLCPGGVMNVTGGTGVADPYAESRCPAGKCDHGTHVAGIAAGVSSSLGVDPQSGMAPGAKIVGVQVFSWVTNGCESGSEDCPLAYNSDIVAGLNWVYNNRSSFDGSHAALAAVNMSLGGGRYYTQASCDTAYGAVKTAIDQLRAAGVATVISSGNDGYRDSAGGPGCISTAVSVGAVCDTSGGWACPVSNGVDAVASYSNIAPFVSLLAPGSYIKSSISGDGYAEYSGTSMAAPMVTGAWALMKDKTPGASVTDTLNLLRTNAVTVNDTRMGGTATGLKRIDLAFLARQLAVSKTGSGGGTVADGGGINCDSGNTSCAATLLDGSSTTLTATAAPGSIFAGWGGACSGTAATCNLTMDGNKTVTAVFNLTGSGGGSGLTTPGIAVTKAGSGSGTIGSSPAHLNCGSLCTKSLPNGTKVTLTAIPAAGSVFVGWSGAQAGACASSTQQMCQVTVSGGMNIIATFNQAAAPLSLGVTLGGAGQGTVTSAPAGINCGSTCSGNYTAGTQVTLTAVASTGSQFVGWNGGGCSGTGTCTVTLASSTQVTANFSLLPQWAKLNFKAVTPGIASLTASSGFVIPCTADAGYSNCVFYPIGSQIALYPATPQSGYRFSAWGEDCAGTDALSHCQLTMSQTRNVSLAAKQQFALTASVAGPGFGHVLSAPTRIDCTNAGGAGCVASFDDGDVVTLTASANSGSVFSSWTAGPCNGSSTPTCSVTMGQARAATAAFAVAPLTTPGVVITKQGSGAGRVASSPAHLNCGSICSKALPRGTVLTLSAIPASGSTFGGWSGSGAGACGSLQMCRITVTGPMDVRATFN